MFKYQYFFVVLLLFISCNKQVLERDVAKVHKQSVGGLSVIRFLNPQIGFACGGKKFESSIILRTLDGGENWQEMSLPANTEKKRLYGLAISPLGHVIAVGYGGVVFTSIDTGRTWKFIQEPIWKEWQSVQFRNSTDAFLCGMQSLNDGFVTSISASLFNSFTPATTHRFAMADIQFPDSMHAYIAGFGAVYASRDGGQTWTFTSAKNDFFTSMVWFDKDNGLVVGWEGSILKTTNGAKDWQKINKGNTILQKNEHFKAITKNSMKELILVGEKGCCLFSSDEGNTWIRISSFTEENLEDVFFRDDRTVFAVGEEGSIFKISL